MLGSEFVKTYASKGLNEWERAAVELASKELNVQWPMIPVPVELVRGQRGLLSLETIKGIFYVTSDYFAIGTPEDYIRLPLLPGTAQEIANQKNLLLPTSKMVDAIWKSSEIRLTPTPLQNKEANLNQFYEHSRVIDDQLDTAPNRDRLTSGHKKDIVISNGWQPGKVVIYGWHRPDGRIIQDRTNVHGSNYVDYSHGVRFVAPFMQVDGQNYSVEEVLRSSNLSGLLSNEGPIKNVRYPASKYQKLNYYQLGIQTILSKTKVTSRGFIGFVYSPEFTGFMKAKFS